MDIQIIYSSKAVREFDDLELAKLLEVSVQNNSRRNVTGLLLYAHGNFMQVLEGEGDVVDSIISRISNDSRHHHVNILVRTPIRAREFGKWHMGFHQLRDVSSQDWANFAPFFEDGFDTSKIADQSSLALKLMQALAYQHNFAD